MSLIKRNTRIWRLAFLALLVVAISGPWVFDRIHVPSPYECDAPNVRLDEDFCGSPLSLAWFFSEMVRAIPYINAGPDAAGMDARSLLVLLVPFLFLLPILSTLVLILWKNHGPWQDFHIIVLGLTAAISTFYAFSVLSTLLSGSQAEMWALWGIWLYFGLVVVMLFLEVLVMRFSGDRARDDTG